LGDVKHLKHEPLVNEALVSHLEELVEEAKIGKMKGIIYGIEYNGGSWATHSFGRISVLGAIGLLEMAKNRYMARATVKE